MRVVFMGTPEFAVPTLAEIVGAGHEIRAVYCQPPRPAGRGQAERKSAVHSFAEAARLPVVTPRSLKGEREQAEFAAHAADVAVVVAYGLLLPKPILEAPVHGCLNLHPSKLPRWRGAAPIQRTIMAGDRETAVMVMRMDQGLDTGPVCMSEPIIVPPDMTAGALHDLAARRGADLMLRALGALARGTLDCRPQAADGATYAAKIEKSEARIDWSRPASEVHDRIRGLSPHPGAWLEVGPPSKRERIKVLQCEVASGSAAPGTILDDQLTVACSSGAVRLLMLQRAGKAAMSAAELLRGYPISRGTRLD
ncbi:MAG: methionyl-tRNA formyltransferase [Hyphomicrobiaceae bacterium]